MQDKLIEALTREYISAYLINLEDDTYEVLKYPATTRVMDNASPVWSVACGDFAEECSEDTKVIVRNFADPLYLSVILKDRDSNESVYRHVKSSGSQWRRSVVQVIERKDGLPYKVLLTISMLDKLAAQKEKLMQLVATQNTAYLDQKNSILESLPIYKLVYEEGKNNSRRLFEGLKVLVVDDSDMIRTLNSEILSDAGAVVTGANDGKDAVNHIKKGEKYDFILMDIVMPVLDGIEAVKEIAEYEKSQDVQSPTPIVGLTAEGSPEQIKEMIACGAFACMPKPLNISELSRVLIANMKQKSNLMEEKLAEIKVLANTDMLTQTGNIVAYTKAINDFEDRKENIGIVFCDCDNLKGINDTYGHDIGDVYIKNCCNMIRGSFPDGTLYRIGGDEFAVIIQSATLEQLDNSMAVINRKSQERSEIDDVADGKAAVSAGCAVFDPELDLSLRDTMKRADMQMYENKMLHKKWNSYYTKFR